MISCLRWQNGLRKGLYYLPLNHTTLALISFDLWMLRAKVDTFVLIVHFLNDKWEPCHIRIGFFETKNTFGNAMALQINDVLAKYGVNVQIITYVKDEGGNLNTMTNALPSVVSYETLGL